MYRPINPDYYGCDCDKYNPNCRCHPKKKATPAPAGDRYYVEDTEEGWGVFDRTTGRPVAGPSIDRGVIDRICASRNQGLIAEQGRQQSAPAGDDAAAWTYDEDGPFDESFFWDVMSDIPEHCQHGPKFFAYRAAAQRAAQLHALGLADPPKPKDCPTCHNTGVVMDHTVPNGIAIKSTHCPDCGRRQVAMNEADPPGARRVDIGDEFRDAAIDLREASYDALNNHKFETEREKKSFDRMCGAILRFNDAERALAAREPRTLR